MTEEEIVVALAEHFDTLVQDSINVQNITTIRDFERLLQKEDIKDRPKGTRPSNYNGNHSNQNTRPNIQHQTQQPNAQAQSYNYRAYQPKPQYQNNKPYNQPSYNNSGTQHYRQSQNQNHQNNNRNYNRYHHNDKPYQREQGHQKPQFYHNRSYPSAEQNQVCTVIRQIPDIHNPPPMNRTYEPSRTITPNNSPPPQQGNDHAL